MESIKKIIKNLRNKKNQEFIIINNDLDMQWILGFEFIDNSILMMVNGSTLNSEWFDSLDEINNYLSYSFLSQKGFQIK